jgi:hypothetical protein
VQFATRCRRECQAARLPATSDLPLPTPRPPITRAPRAPTLVMPADDTVSSGHASSAHASTRARTRRLRAPADPNIAGGSGGRSRETQRPTYSSRLLPTATVQPQCPCVQFEGENKGVRKPRRWILGAELRQMGHGVASERRRLDRGDHGAGRAD